MDTNDKSLAVRHPTGVVPTMVRHLAMTLAVMLIAGCVPSGVYDTPPVHGEVFDAVTYAPVPNATILVKSENNPGVTATASTNATGYFKAEPIVREVWRPIMFDYGIPNAIIEIAAAGYESQTVDFYTLNKSRRIYLKPQ